MFLHEQIISQEKVDVSSLPSNVKLEISKFAIAVKQNQSERVLNRISENIHDMIKKIVDRKKELEIRERNARAMELEAGADED